MSTQGILSEARAHGFLKKRLHDPDRTVFEIKCGYCKAPYHIAYKGSTSPEMLCKQMKRTGWLIGKWPPICDKCRNSAHHRGGTYPIDAAPIKPIDLTQSVAIPAPPIAALAKTAQALDDFATAAEKESRATMTNISANPKLARAVFQKLDDVFDQERRMFKPGWTDARVASEAGTSEQIVEHLRKEGGYGELAEAQEISAMRDEVKLYAEMIDADIKQFRAELDQQTKACGQMIRELEQKRLALDEKYKVKAAQLLEAINELPGAIRQPASA